MHANAKAAVNARTFSNFMRISSTSALPCSLAWRAQEQLASEYTAHARTESAARLSSATTTSRSQTRNFFSALLSNYRTGALAGRTFWILSWYSAAFLFSSSLVCRDSLSSASYRSLRRRAEERSSSSCRIVTCISSSWAWYSCGTE